MRQVKADLRQLDNLDIPRQAVRLKGNAPSLAQIQAFQRPMLKTAIDLGSSASQTISLCHEPVSIFESAPTVTLLPPISAPITTALAAGIASGTIVITLGIGLEANGFAFLGATVQGGLYGSNSPNWAHFSRLEAAGGQTSGSRRVLFSRSSSGLLLISPA